MPRETAEMLSLLPPAPQRGPAHSAPLRLVTPVPSRLAAVPLARPAIEDALQPNFLASLQSGRKRGRGHRGPNAPMEEEEVLAATRVTNSGRVTKKRVLMGSSLPPPSARARNASMLRAAAAAAAHGAPALARAAPAWAPTAGGAFVDAAGRVWALRLPDSTQEYETARRDVFSAIEAEQARLLLGDASSSEGEAPAADGAPSKERDLVRSAFGLPDGALPPSRPRGWGPAGAGGLPRAHPGAAAALPGTLDRAADSPVDPFWALAPVPSAGIASPPAVVQAALSDVKAAARRGTEGSGGGADGAAAEGPVAHRGTPDASAAEPSLLDLLATAAGVAENLDAPPPAGGGKGKVAPVTSGGSRASDPAASAGSRPRPASGLTPGAGEPPARDSRGGDWPRVLQAAASGSLALGGAAASGSPATDGAASRPRRAGAGRKPAIGTAPTTSRRSSLSDDGPTPGQRVPAGGATATEPVPFWTLGRVALPPRAEAGRASGRASGRAAVDVEMLVPDPVEVAKLAAALCSERDSLGAALSLSPADGTSPPPPGFGPGLVSPASPVASVLVRIQRSPEGSVQLWRSQDPVAAITQRRRIPGRGTSSSGGAASAGASSGASGEVAQRAGRPGAAASGGAAGPPNVGLSAARDGATALPLSSVSPGEVASAPPGAPPVDGAGDGSSHDWSVVDRLASQLGGFGPDNPPPESMPELREAWHEAMVLAFRKTLLAEAGRPSTAAPRASPRAGAPAPASSGAERTPSPPVSD